MVWKYEDKTNSYGSHDHDSWYYSGRLSLVQRWLLGEGCDIAQYLMILCWGFCMRRNEFNAILLLAPNQLCSQCNGCFKGFCGIANCLNYSYYCVHFCICIIYINIYFVWSIGFNIISVVPFYVCFNNLHEYVDEIFSYLMSVGSTEYVKTCSFIFSPTFCVIEESSAIIFLYWITCI